VALWAGAVLLLTAEILGLTIRYDGGVLIGHQGWWAGVLMRSSMVAQLGIAIAAATLLLVGARSWGEFRGISGRLHAPRHAWGFFLIHVVIYAGFAGMTSLVLGVGPGSPLPSGGRVLAWATMGLATLASWGAIVLPVALWIELARRGGRTVLAGVAVGGAAWGISRLTAALWEPLGRSTLWLVHGVLGLVSRETIFLPDEMVVGIEPFGILIAPGCSGYEGIGLILIFYGAYLWLFRSSLRFPHAFLLLPLGAAVIWIANALRIILLIMIGAWWSPEIAGGGFHSQAGWLAFNAIGLGMVAATRHVRFFRHEAGPEVVSAAGPNPAVAYLAPLSALVAATMLTAAFTTGFDWLYPLRALATGGALWICWRGHAGRWWRNWSWEAVGIGLGVFVLWMALEPVPPSGPSGGPSPGAELATASRFWAAFWIAFRVLGSVVTVPLAEELAFRGYLTRRLISADFQGVPPGRFSWFSFLVSSALFGALHQRWLAGSLAGMFYALALYRRGKVADAVLAHAVTNGLIAAYVLTMGTWTLWS
jgi:exosortase E/protease (VPEID-CTERM system)